MSANIGVTVSISVCLPEVAGLNLGDIVSGKQEA